jgi:hypothetical protein
MNMTLMSPLSSQSGPMYRCLHIDGSSVSETWFSDLLLFIELV